MTTAELAQTAARHEAVHQGEAPKPPRIGPQLARRLVLPNSFYSPSVASQRGSIHCVHEVRRGEKRCLSSLRLLTWR